MPALRTREFGLVQRVTILASVAIFVSTLIVMGLALVRDLDRSITAERDLLLSYSAIFTTAISPAVAADDKPSAVTALTSIGKLPRITFAEVTTLNGRVFASVGTDYVVQGQVVDITEKASLSSTLRTRLGVKGDIIRGGELQGTLTILSDTSFLRARLVNGLLEILLIALALTCIAGAASIFLLRSAIKPVVTLTEAIEASVDDKTFAKSTETDRRDEIGRLGASFNTMIDGLIERDQTIQSHVETLEDTVAQRTQQYREARDSAEQANAAKSDFLATMSHEIRTPLNGMLVMAELLANGQLPHRQKRYADVIQSSGQGLLAIINDILDLSKIEASKLELEAIPVDLDTFIENTTALFAAKAGEKGLTIGTYVAPGTPRQFIGDPTRLGQILTNLINNAIKFTETGGVAIHVSPLRDGSGISLSVIDTGIGIPPDRLHSVFEAFSQADQSTTRQYGGTGLGLSICTKLVAAMGGKIGVRSEVGQGSIFTCRLPLESTQDALPRTRDAGKSVLLLHNEEVSLRFLGMMLLSHGFEVYAHPAAEPPAGSFDYVLATENTLKTQRKLASDLGGQGICLLSMGDGDGEAIIAASLASAAVTLPIGPGRFAELCEGLQYGDFTQVMTGLSPQDIVAPLRTFETLHVLAADDNPVNREVLNEALQTLGVKAEFFEAAVPLLERMSECEPDVVFLDISMPGMSGVEALQRILAADADHTPRIAALTAHVTHESRRELTGHGFETIISKPFTLSQISDFLAGAAPAPAEESYVDSKPEADRFWDQSVLRDFEETTGRKGFADRMIALFQTNCETGLSNVAASLGRDADAIKQAAHAFKSMASTVGATRLTELCAAIEADPETLSKDVLLELSNVTLQTVTLMGSRGNAATQKVAGASRNAVA